MPKPKQHDPTPEEIRQMCEQIQSEWTPAQRERRASGYAPQQWRVQENVTLRKE